MKIEKLEFEFGACKGEMRNKINEIIGIINDIIKEFHEQGIEICDTENNPS